MSERRYALTFSKRALKALGGLPKEVAARLSRAAEALAINPRPYGYIKMKGSQDEYRIRVDQYRIVYQIEDDKLIILVIDVGPRKDIYR